MAYGDLYSFDPPIMRATATCDKCGDEMYWYEKCFLYKGKILCHDCYDKIVKDKTTEEQRDDMTEWQIAEMIGAQIFTAEEWAREAGLSYG